jgi:hypothetical protein
VFYPPRSFYQGSFQQQSLHGNEISAGAWTGLDFKFILDLEQFLTLEIIERSQSLYANRSTI